MAEVYGEKPKKFTKEWWPYYWMYYKWQTIGVIFTIVAILVTVYQCKNREKFDLTVTYGASATIDQSTVDKLEVVFSSMAEDSDGDGHPNVYFQQLNFANIPGTEETDQALQTKLDMGMTEDDSMLYIFDGNELAIMAQRKNSGEIYMNVHDWLDDEEFERLSEEEGKIIFNQEEIPIAVSIADSTIMKEHNINAKNMYVLVRMNYKDEEFPKSAQRSAIKIAKELLK
ncbi:MAG: hypothetical protein J1G06_06085 [Oscillospiraceae bacterium]|nr:hypothetical protein [Oscillospiraceae bacterium]